MENDIRLVKDRKGDSAGKKQTACLCLLSIAAVNTTTKANLGRKGFISALHPPGHTPSLREARASALAGVLADCVEGCFLLAQSAF